MLHHVYKEEVGKNYPIALLIKNSAFNLHELEQNYILELEANGISRDDIIIISLPYDNGNKVTQRFAKETARGLLAGLVAVGTKTIYCADATYFKVLTKETKAEANIGYNRECRYEDYEDCGFDVVMGVNHKSLLHNPANESKLSLSIATLIDVAKGRYTDFAQDILKNVDYLSTAEEIAAGLNQLHQHPHLFIDIEGYSLRFNEAKIATIGFAWNQTDGIAFACDYKDHDSEAIRSLLVEFFESYQGEKVFHNAPYDLKSLILNLWMNEDLMDRAGMLKGLDIMCRNLHDTKIIAYLATNTCAGNHLGLKDLAHEYVGQYAIDVKDITQHELPVILEYNLTDCCATSYIYDKYWPMMVDNAQLDVYNNLFMPSLKTLIQTEMVGMPLNPERVQEVKLYLQGVTKKHLDYMLNSQIIRDFEADLQLRAMLKKNAELKVKQHTIDQYSDPDSPQYVGFNPNSAPQLQRLIYEHMGLPVLERTKKKQPSTKAEHLKALKHHTNNVEHLELIDALTQWAEAEKILNTFISAFERALDKGEEVYWLHGSFNLGGTKSGRLSSSDPNLQNLPSGKTYGKLIKSCFQAPKGWIFGGADFASLEDRISALITKDENKLKVYTQGYDGHSLRAHTYFPERMPDIVTAEPGETCYQLKTTKGTFFRKGSDLLVQKSGNHIKVEDYVKANPRLGRQVSC